MCSFPELGTALLRVGIHKFAGLLYLVRLLLRLRGVGSWGIRAATLPKATVEAREGALASPLWALTPTGWGRINAVTIVLSALWWSVSE